MIADTGLRRKLLLTESEPNAYKTKVLSNLEERRMDEWMYGKAGDLFAEVASAGTAVGVFRVLDPRTTAFISSFP